MKLSAILKKEIERSNGALVVKRVPESKQPSFESLRRADEMIAAQVKANDAILYANQSYIERQGF